MLAIDHDHTTGKARASSASSATSASAHCRIAQTSSGKQSFTSSSESGKQLSRASKIVDGKKQCGKCREWLPIEDFYKNAKSATGLASACKACTLVVHQTARYHLRYKERDPEGVAAEKRRQHIKTIYAVTPEWYDAIMAAQDGVCAICGQPEFVMRYGKVKLLSVDHDHESGRARGLLCQGSTKA